MQSRKPEILQIDRTQPPSKTKRNNPGTLLPLLMLNNRTIASRAAEIDLLISALNNVTSSADSWKLTQSFARKLVDSISALSTAPVLDATTKVAIACMRLRVERGKISLPEGLIVVALGNRLLENCSVAELKSQHDSFIEFQRILWAQYVDSVNAAVGDLSDNLGVEQLCQTIMQIRDIDLNLQPLILALPEYQNGMDYATLSRVHKTLVAAREVVYVEIPKEVQRLRAALASQDLSTFLAPEGDIDTDDPALIEWKPIDQWFSDDDDWEDALCYIGREDLADEHFFVNQSTYALLRLRDLIVRVYAGDHAFPEGITNQTKQTRKRTDSHRELLFAFLARCDVSVSDLISTTHIKESIAEALLGLLSELSGEKRRSRRLLPGIDEFTLNALSKWSDREDLVEFKMGLDLLMPIYYAAVISCNIEKVHPVLHKAIMMIDDFFSHHDYFNGKVCRRMLEVARAARGGPHLLLGTAFHLVANSRELFAGSDYSFNDAVSYAKDIALQMPQRLLSSDPPLHKLASELAVKVEQDFGTEFVRQYYEKIGYIVNLQNTDIDGLIAQIRNYNIPKSFAERKDLLASHVEYRRSLDNDWDNASNDLNLIVKEICGRVVRGEFAHSALSKYFGRQSRTWGPAKSVLVKRRVFLAIFQFAKRMNWSKDKLLTQLGYADETRGTQRQREDPPAKESFPTYLSDIALTETVAMSPTRELLFPEEWIMLSAAQKWALSPSDQRLPKNR